MSIQILQLGDIIKGDNDDIYMVEYIDSETVHLRDEVFELHKYTLHAESGTIYSNFTSLKVLARQSSKSYLIQHNVPVGATVTLLGKMNDSPIQLRGKIQSIRDDIAEILPYDAENNPIEEDSLFVDFANQGLPQSPIQVVDLLLEDETGDKNFHLGRVKMLLKAALKLVEHIRNTDTNNDDDNDESSKSNSNSSDVVIGVGEIINLHYHVHATHAQFRHSIESQVHALYQDLIDASAKPRYIRVADASRGVDNFLELRQNYADINAIGNVVGAKKVTVHTKPLASALNSSNFSSYWIRYVTRNKSNFFIETLSDTNVGGQDYELKGIAARRNNIFSKQTNSDGARAYIKYKNLLTELAANMSTPFVAPYNDADFEEWGNESEDFYKQRALFVLSDHTRPLQTLTDNWGYPDALISTRLKIGKKDESYIQSKSYISTYLPAFLGDKSDISTRRGGGKNKLITNNNVIIPVEPAYIDSVVVYPDALARFSRICSPDSANILVRVQLSEQFSMLNKIAQLDILKEEVNSGAQLAQPVELATNVVPLRNQSVEDYTLNLVPRTMDLVHRVGKSPYMKHTGSIADFINALSPFYIQQRDINAHVLQTVRYFVYKGAVYPIKSHVRESINSIRIVASTPKWSSEHHLLRSMIAQTKAQDRLNAQSSRKKYRVQLRDYGRSKRMYQPSSSEYMKMMLVANGGSQWVLEEFIERSAHKITAEKDLKNYPVQHFQTEDHLKTLNVQNMPTGTRALVGNKTQFQLKEKTRWMPINTPKDASNIQMAKDDSEIVQLEEDSAAEGKRISVLANDGNLKYYQLEKKKTWESYGSSSGPISLQTTVPIFGGAEGRALRLTLLDRSVSAEEVAARKRARNNLSSESQEIIQRIRSETMSPYAEWLPQILANPNFGERQNLIYNFCQKYTTSAVHALSMREASKAVDESEEAKELADRAIWWRYCNKTYVPLIPLFRYTLAEQYVKGGGIEAYTTALNIIIQSNGVQNEDDDQWIDRYSGEAIIPIQFIQENAWMAESNNEEEEEDSAVPHSLTSVDDDDVIDLLLVTSILNALSKLVADPKSFDFQTPRIIHLILIADRSNRRNRICTKGKLLFSVSIASARVILGSSFEIKSILKKIYKNVGDTNAWGGLRVPPDADTALKYISEDYSSIVNLSEKDPVFKAAVVPRSEQKAQNETVLETTAVVHNSSQIPMVPALIRSNAHIQKPVNELSQHSDYVNILIHSYQIQRQIQHSMDAQNPLFFRHIRGGGVQPFMSNAWTPFSDVQIAKKGVISYLARDITAKNNALINSASARLKHAENAFRPMFSAAFMPSKIPLNPPKIALLQCKSYVAPSRIHIAEEAANPFESLVGIEGATQTFGKIVAYLSKDMNIEEKVFVDSIVNSEIKSLQEEFLVNCPNDAKRKYNDLMEILNSRGDDENIVQHLRESIYLIGTSLPILLLQLSQLKVDVALKHWNLNNVHVGRVNEIIKNQWEHVKTLHSICIENEMEYVETYLKQVMINAQPILKLIDLLHVDVSERCSQRVVYRILNYCYIRILRSYFRIEDVMHDQYGIMQNRLNVQSCIVKFILVSQEHWKKTHLKNIDENSSLSRKYREAEKKDFLRRIDNMSQDERVADSIMRAHGLGHWRIGSEKGYTQYNKNNFEENRQRADNIRAQLPEEDRFFLEQFATIDAMFTRNEEEQVQDDIVYAANDVDDEQFGDMDGNDNGE